MRPDESQQWQAEAWKAKVAKLRAENEKLKKALDDRLAYEKNALPFVAEVERLRAENERLRAKVAGLENHLHLYHNCQHDGA